MSERARARARSEGIPRGPTGERAGIMGAAKKTAVACVRAPSRSAVYSPCSCRLWRMEVVGRIQQCARLLWAALVQALDFLHFAQRLQYSWQAPSCHYFLVRTSRSSPQSCRRDLHVSHRSAGQGEYTADQFKLREKKRIRASFNKRDTFPFLGLRLFLFC